MASSVPLDPSPGPGQHLHDGPARPWDNLRRLSSVLHNVEAFLESRPFERGPWLAVAFGGGIAAWFVLPAAWDWAALVAACAALACAASLLARSGSWPHLAHGFMAVSLAIAAGTSTAWLRSALVGAPGIERLAVAQVEGTIVDRQDQSAQGRIRLVVEGRVHGFAPRLRVRVNLAAERDMAGLVPGATVRFRAQLMPPAAPMLPGGYDFARAAWFQGLAATGRVLGQVTLVRPPAAGQSLRAVQQRLSDHVRSRLDGSPGAIAAALASGDRGGIAPADEEAMRDAGLTHLLSISGLHVSAVVGAVYVIAIRLLALSPWLALRVRLPLMASALGALAGIGYTLLTGAEVPTVRSCVGAVLVLGALALGRDPLSMRMVAVAAVFVMLFWPEAVPGPSFQMSFASVIAIVTLHSSTAAREFLSQARRGLGVQIVHNLAMLLVTGIAIELALLPIGMFHFHRAGVYGALANVVAIPLTTFVTMPLVAAALLLDTAGWGAPAWWLAGKSLDLLLALAHFTAGQPGSVGMMPSMPRWMFALFVSGGLWLALWSGRVRMWGLLPVAAAAGAMATVRPPDVLIPADGRNVGIAGEGAALLMLRAGNSDYVRDTMLEAAGQEGAVEPVDGWRGARCNRDFCAVTLVRGGRPFHLLLARGRDLIDDLPLAAACEGSDIVVADRRLPRSCSPRLLKADRALLERTGGLAIDLETGTVRSVASEQGNHGWERHGRPLLPRRPKIEPGQADAAALPKKTALPVPADAGNGHRPAERAFKAAD